MEVVPTGRKIERAGSGVALAGVAALLFALFYRYPPLTPPHRLIRNDRVCLARRDAMLQTSFLMESGEIKHAVPEPPRSVNHLLVLNLDYARPCLSLRHCHLASMGTAHIPGLKTSNCTRTKTCFRAT
jgi:hypothetical protein